MILSQSAKSVKNQLLTNQYLTHYWPFFDGKMNDEIGTAHMTQGSLTSFVSDRFGNANSALALNGGWTQVPSGVYFDSTAFSISVWVYPQQVSSYSRIIDFGNGQSSDNILFALSNGNTLQPYFYFFNGSITLFSTTSKQNLTLNEWQFLTATFNSTHLSIYLNAKLTACPYNKKTLSYVLRTKCYIGKSNWAGDGYSYSILDDLRFYNKSLSQTEILDLMNYYNSCRNSFSFN